MALLTAKTPATANTPALLYAPPAGKIGTVNVLMSNFDTAAGTISLWLSTQNGAVANIKDAERIETETPVQAKGSVGNGAEKNNITVGDGQALYFAASSVKVAFGVHGYEGIA